MKKLAVVLTVLMFTCALAFAQSSGSFSAAVARTACTLNNTTGALGAGLPGDTVLSATVQTPNSSSTALDIRFSAVTGLFTDTKVSNTVSSSYATAGVTVFVTMDGQPVAPNQTCGTASTNPDPGCYCGVDPDYPDVCQTGVVYDERFQSVSQNFLNLLAGVVDCTTTNTGTCQLELILSTLSAHSMDYVAPSVGGGNHNLKVQWAITNVVSNANNASAGACVGPGVLTVTQVKNFSQNSTISIQ